MRTFYIVAEREECVRAQCHLRVLRKPRLALVCGQRFGLFGEEQLPRAFLQEVFVFVGNIDVDGVVAVGTAYSFLERQVHHLRTLSQPPFVSLASCQSCAVNAALLPCSDTDSLSVFHVAYRVALCIFQRYERNYKVAFRLFGKALVLGWHILEQLWVVEFYLVAPLFEGYAKHLLAFYRRRLIVWVYLDNVIIAFALRSEYFECLWRIVGSYHAVAHFAVDESGSSLVASVAQSAEVAIRAHTVGTSRTSVSRSKGRKFKVNIVYEVNLLQRVAKRQTYGCTSRAYVLERCCGRQASSGFQFLDKLPTVKCIEEVDVAWATVQHFDRQFSFVHKNARRFLIGIATILEFQFFHIAYGVCVCIDFYYSCKDRQIK